MTDNANDRGDAAKLAGYSERRLAQRGIDELLGLIRGIVADRDVSETEATCLMEWTLANPRLGSVWPCSAVVERLARIFDDAIVDDEERDGLRLMLEQLTGGEADPGTHRLASSEFPLEVPMPAIVLAKHRFCLTGTFLHGKRSHCEACVTTNGGTVHTSVKKDTDYLVIGQLATAAWLHSSFGTKVMKAVDYRAKLGRPLIVSEEAFVSALQGGSRRDG